MSGFAYTADELFSWLVARKEMIVLDVRNEKDFTRFKVESPYPFDMINVSYYDFMEDEKGSVEAVPDTKPVRIVCAKEGSARYVADILDRNGYEDVAYLSGGIKTWGNLLVPKMIEDADGYQLFQFIRPGKASCSYGLLADGEMMLFDPSRNIHFYMDFALKHNCRIIKTFETHLQADYIAGSRMVAAETGAEFLANENDFQDYIKSYKRVVHGQVHSFSRGNPEVKVMFTPGHTPGSTSFIVDNKYMISGDMVFIASIGRPDLGGKVDDWSAMLFDSMLKVKELPPELMVLPGHYMSWDEADERLAFCASLKDIIERNRGIYSIDSLEDFMDFIKRNMRPQPEEYAEIRQVNASLKVVDEEREEELDLGKNECAATAYAESKGR